MPKNDGGPAYPVLGMSQRNGQEFLAVFNNGMTLREYFAAKAMQSLLISPGQMGNDCRANDERLSCWSFQIADAMLAERERNEKENH